jgi:hypothetical protein
VALLSTLAKLGQDGVVDRRLRVDEALEIERIG